MRFFQLFRRYILRDLLRNRARAALTISGIALGVAVVVAVQLANDRAIGSFADSMATLAGTADLEITANGLPLPETLMSSLSWVWDYGAMSPVVRGRGVLAGDPVQIYGFDLLGEHNRLAGEAHSTDRQEVSAPEGSLDAIVNPRRAILPAALADRHRLSAGSPFQMVLGDRRETFTVGEVLANQGAAKAFSGNVVFFDIAAAQLALGKIGVLDRIDISLANKSDREAVRKRVAASLPATAIVDVPESAALQTEKLLRAFRYNLTALSYVSLIVGVILVYNTLTVAVIRRRSEIGMLRTMGSPRTMIAAFFLMEAACLGAIGAAVGIGFGELLSRVSGAMVTRTIESLYTGVFAPASGSGFELHVYIEIAAVGILLSIASGLAPALRATAVSPATVLREGSATTGGAGRGAPAAAWGVMLIALAVLVGRQPPVVGFPFFGYAAALLLIAGFGLLAPLFSRATLFVLAWPVRSAAPVAGRLAMQAMRASQSRIVTAVLSLGIAVAMLVSVVTMVSSFRETVIVWVNQTLRADLYLRAGAAGPNDWENPFDPNTVGALANLPGVAAIDRYRGRPLMFHGSSVILAAGEFPVMSRYSGQIFMDGRRASDLTDRMVNQNRVIVSEPLSIKQRVHKGDAVMLPTPAGLVRFEVEDVYYDYSNDRGTIVMDRSTYLRLYRDPSVTNIAVYLKPGEDPAAVQQEIAQRLPGAALRVISNAELKRQVLQVFDQTFQVTYALEAIALVVAILGIANTLSALILERRAEFSMLRFLGAGKQQLRRMVVLESGAVGLMGAALGFALGIALAVVLIFVINKQSFGWTIQFITPGWFIAQSLITIVLATLVAGLYPAALATRMDAIQGVRTE